MDRAVFHELLRTRLDEAGLAVAEIRLTPDPFGQGYRVAVISEGFKGMPLHERTSLVLAGYEDAVTWSDLLTPDEARVTPLGIDAAPDDLPLWPERLAHTERPPARRPSPTDDTPLTPPLTAVFYSLRGGVGRSTTLAATAWHLARKGRRVVCVDMDLEAPGLSTLFNVRDEAVAQVRGVVGVLEGLDLGQDIDLQAQLVRLREDMELYLLPAGRLSAGYARSLRGLDPDGWARSEHNPLHLLFNGLRALPLKPDIILVDARTGFSALNAPLIFEQADVAVVCLFPSLQAKVGTDELVRGLAGARTWRSTPVQPVAPAVRFVAGPVPARDPSGFRRLENRFNDWVGDWLDLLGDRSLPPEVSLVLRYDDAIALQDRVAGDDPWGSYRGHAPVAEWMLSFLPAAGDAVDLSPRKDRVLAGLSFEADTAERLTELSGVVQTEAFKRALQADRPVVLGRKGSGKTLVFRYLERREEGVVITAPGPLASGRPWIPNERLYREVGETLDRARLPWSHFWRVFVPRAWTAAHLQAMGQPVESAEQFLTELIRDLPERPILRGKNEQPDESPPESPVEALVRASERRKAPTFLLFDGLDTSFGADEAALARRTAAIEGLFAWHMDMESRLPNLPAKILLRKDIWEQTRFPNKSHYFSRTATLVWEDQWTYLNVALKQALAQDDFRALLPATLASRADEIERWSDEDAETAWEILVAPRMKGNGGAWSANWVWNRLSDGSGVRAPRTLLQLMEHARRWEKDEQRRNPTFDGILRPRALEESLPAVSQAALSALIDEEFPMLTPLRKQLERLGTARFEAKRLGVERSANMAAQVALAREVGLLEPEEDAEGVVTWYRVPELYRYALKLGRKGPK